MTILKPPPWTLSSAGRTTTPTMPRINRVGREWTPAQYVPAAVRQAVPMPTRSSERYASLVTNSDVRPFPATGQPRCQHRRQSDFRRAYRSRLSRSARSAPLFGDILYHSVVPGLSVCFLLLLHACYAFMLIIHK